MKLLNSFLTPFKKPAQSFLRVLSKNRHQRKHGRGKLIRFKAFFPKNLADRYSLKLVELHIMNSKIYLREISRVLTVKAVL